MGQLAFSADIVLRDKIAPVKSVVSLGDIADIQATSLAERQRLALTPLWVSPPLGEQRFVTSQQVIDILVHHGFDPARLNVYGAPRVAIGWKRPAEAEQPAKEDTPSGDQNLPATNSMGFRVPRAASLFKPDEAHKRDPVFLSTVQREQLADQVREAVMMYIEDQTGKVGLIEVELSLQQRQGDLLSLQKSDVSVAGGQAPWTGRQRFDIEFDSEKGPLKLSLYAIVYDTTPVLVAKRPIARGQLITAADVAIGKPPRNARVAAGRVPVYSLEESLGKEAGRAVREGQIVTTEMCLEPQMIERGALVSVVSAGSGIVIRRQATATRDARYGDVTEVQLLDSRERLVARVVGHGELATLGSSLRPRTASGARQTPKYR